MADDDDDPGSASVAVVVSSDAPAVVANHRNLGLKVWAGERLRRDLLNWRLFLVRMLTSGLAVCLTVVLLPGLSFTRWSRGEFLLVGFVFGLLNAIVKPVLPFFSLRYLVASYGVVVVLINAVLLWLLSAILGGALHAASVLTVLAAGFVVGAVGAEPLSASRRGVGVPALPGEACLRAMEHLTQVGEDVVQRPVGVVPVPGVLAVPDQRPLDRVGQVAVAGTAQHGAGRRRARPDDERYEDEPGSHRGVRGPARVSCGRRNLRGLTASTRPRSVRARSAPSRPSPGVAAGRSTVLPAVVTRGVTRAGGLLCASPPRTSERAGTTTSRESAMALFMDVHNIEGGVGAADVAAAHEADLAHQDAHGVSYRKYWVDEEAGRIFCLVEAPNAEAANTVHREAHGLVADEIFLVSEHE